jgi:superfamily II DNA helicase RecQ
MAMTDIVIDSINKLALELFGFKLCEWQPPVITAQLNNEKGPCHVLCTAATGAGKTAIMLLPALMRPRDITIIVSPLNLLTEQTSSIATKIGIKSVALMKETSNVNLLKVHILHSQCFSDHATGDRQWRLLTHLYVSRDACQYRLFCHLQIKQVLQLSQTCSDR